MRQVGGASAGFAYISRDGKLSVDNLGVYVRLLFFGSKLVVKFFFWFAIYGKIIKNCLKLLICDRIRSRNSRLLGARLAAGSVTRKSHVGNSGGLWRASVPGIAEGLGARGSSGRGPSASLLPHRSVQE